MKAPWHGKMLMMHLWMRKWEHNILWSIWSSVWKNSYCKNTEHLQWIHSLVGVRLVFSLLFLKNLNESVLCLAFCLIWGNQKKSWFLFILLFSSTIEWNKYPLLRFVIVSKHNHKAPGIQQVFNRSYRWCSSSFFYIFIFIFAGERIVYHRGQEWEFLSQKRFRFKYCYLAICTLIKNVCKLITLWTFFFIWRWRRQ